MTWVSLVRFPPLPEVPEPMRGRAFALAFAAFLGEEDAGRALLAPLRDLGPQMDTFAMVPPAALSDMAMDPPEPLPFEMSHGLLETPSPDAIDALIEATDPARVTELDLVQVRHMGGALGRVAPGAGARATLPGEVCWLALGVAPDATARAGVARALAGMEEALAPHRAGHYPNFVERPSDASGFFDAATWARLRRVKARARPRRTCSGGTTTCRPTEASSEDGEPASGDTGPTPRARLGRALRGRGLPVRHRAEPVPRLVRRPDRRRGPGALRRRRRGPQQRLAGAAGPRRRGVRRVAGRRGQGPAPGGRAGGLGAVPRRRRGRVGLAARRPTTWSWRSTSSSRHLPSGGGCSRGSRGRCDPGACSCWRATGSSSSPTAPAGRRSRTSSTPSRSCATSCRRSRWRRCARTTRRSTRAPPTRA